MWDVSSGQPTNKLLLERYFWGYLHVWVGVYVSVCHTCASAHGSQNRKLDPLELVTGGCGPPLCMLGTERESSGRAVSAVKIVPLCMLIGVFLCVCGCSGTCLHVCVG